MEDMSRRSFLQKRGSVWWFRCRVPQDLVDHYGKREVLKNLRTRDYAEAQRLVVHIAAEQQREFDALRQARAAPAVAELTQEDIHRLANGWVSEVLREDENNRVDGQPKHVLEEDVGNLQSIEPVLREHLARGEPQLIAAAVSEVLSSAGIKLAQESASLRKLRYESSKRYRRATVAR